MIKIANPEKYIAGLYERLSNEDIEIQNGNVKLSQEDEKESGSIITQKMFLHDFCKNNKINIYEDYTDDGFSGATFDRPNFNRMIEDIEKKKINLVLVKDLSRFGRAVGGVSYYLEEFFIQKGVRFIAINDDIDTGNIETSEEIMQFKSFFNEWFLRDTSKKIKNGKKVRAREGKVMTTYPTYGYQKDPLDHNHYIIDPEVAPIVKRIFMMARSGMTPTQIGRVMTNEGIKVPSEVVGNYHVRRDGEIRRYWNRNTVKRILQNITYIGSVSNGNVKKVSFKSKKTIILPKEDRIIVKDMHEPIIDEETFNIVQAQIKSRTSTRVRTYDWLLKGMVYCKECGKSLGVIAHQHPNKTTFYLRCNTYANDTNAKICTSHCNNLEKVTDIVIKQVKDKCKQFLNVERCLNKANKSKDMIVQDNFNLKNEINVLEKKIKVINKKIDQIYDDKAAGLFDAEDFVRIYTNQKQERARIRGTFKPVEREYRKSSSCNRYKKVGK